MSLIKSNIAKKYWMAFTGLFLCLFLIGHLLGNLQLLIAGEAGMNQFNDYAVFMTTNPAVKILSWLTYISIIFHAIDGAVISYKNNTARGKGYAYSRPNQNSLWASRNMGILGTIILVFIVIHMSNFWYKYHFGELPVYISETGSEIKNLYQIVHASFQETWYVALYVISMIAIAFHLIHGFKSAFDSLGLRHPKYTPIIKGFGYTFAIVVPAAFAFIPLYIYLAN